MQVSYAGYMCRLHMQVTYACYMLWLHMQVTYAGYICRLHMQVTYAYVTYAGNICRLHMHARLHRGGIRWSRVHGANYRRDYNPVVWIVDEADPHVHLSCAALLVSCGGDLTATAATLVNLGKGESPAAKTVLAEIWPPLPRPENESERFGKDGPFSLTELPLVGLEKEYHTCRDHGLHSCAPTQHILWVEGH